PHEHGDPPDGEFTVSWAAGTTGLETPMLVTETRGAPFPTWVLEAAGPAVRVQRRQYVRIPEWDGSAELRLFTSDGALAATVLDLSEGGVRCVVPQSATTAMLVGHVVDLILHI